jgi:hypothetical protein
VCVWPGPWVCATFGLFLGCMWLPGLRVWPVWVVCAAHVRSHPSCLWSALQVTRSTEPKVFVPHERRAGLPPRKVEVERKKRQYAAMVGLVSPWVPLQRTPSGVASHHARASMPCWMAWHSASTASTGAPHTQTRHSESVGVVDPCLPIHTHTYTHIHTITHTHIHIHTYVFWEPPPPRTHSRRMLGVKTTWTYSTPIAPLVHLFAPPPPAGGASHVSPSLYTLFARTWGSCWLGRAWTAVCQPRWVRPPGSTPRGTSAACPCTPSTTATSRSGPRSSGGSLWRRPRRVGGLSNRPPCRMSACACVDACRDVQWVPLCWVTVIDTTANVTCPHTLSRTHVDR